MYLKNDTSPKPIYAILVNASDGSPITTGVTAYHIQGTTRTAGAGTLTHIANGRWAYVPTQAETNYDAFAIDFYHADAVGKGALVEIVTANQGLAIIADAVWDEAQSGHTTAGTFGAYLNAAITSRSSHSAADVWNVASRTVTGGTIDTLNDRTGFQLSAAGIDAIWDEPRSGHTTEGTFGYYLDAQVSSRATPAQAADAVWDEPRAGHTTDGTYGAVDEWAGIGITPQQVWEYTTRTLTAATNITTDNNKIDNSKIAKLDDTITSRAPASTALSTVTWTSTRASNLDKLDATISSRLATTSYVAPDNTGISQIKGQTDKLAFAGTGPYDVKATLDGEEVVVSTNRDKTGYNLTSEYDRAKNALSYTEYITPDNDSILAIKDKTDNLTFDQDKLLITGSTIVSGYDLGQSPDELVWESNYPGVQQLLTVYSAIETGSVAQNPLNTATTFSVNFTVDVEKHLGRFIQFNSNTLNAGLIRCITQVDTGMNSITLDAPLDTIPQVGDMFIFIGYRAQK